MSDNIRETGEPGLAPGAQLIQATRQGLMIVTGPVRDARILFANAEVEFITGFTAPEIEGRNLAFLLADGADPVEMERLLDAMEEGRPASVLIRSRRKAGEAFLAAIDMDPVRDAGRVVYFIATLQDVSERALAQARLAQLSQFETVGRLTGTIAHDFNNILASVRSFAGLLTAAAPATSEEHRYASRIISACQRAADMVRQLLAFVRAQDVPRERVDVREVVNEVAALLHTRVGASTKLSVSATTKQAVLANTSQITQVLLNLATNACDAMAGRGGEVSISARDVAMNAEISAMFDKGLTGDDSGFVYTTDRLKCGVSYVQLTVSDTGAGVPKNIVANIFELFFTTKDRRSGSGLGLAIVHSIVSAYGGVIAVHSRPGSGSAFHVYLPADITPEPSATSSGGTDASRKAHVGGRERMLLVDDEVDVADAFSISLETLGYTVTRAYLPFTALAILKANPQGFDVLVTDQNMPGMQGEILIAEARRINPMLKSVLCSGSGGVDQDYIRGKADTFFGKPGSILELARAIRMACDGQVKAEKR